MAGPERSNKQEQHGQIIENSSAGEGFRKLATVRKRANSVSNALMVWLAPSRSSPRESQICRPEKTRPAVANGRKKRFRSCNTARHSEPCAALRALPGSFDS